jgi:hypothetical protein
MSIVPCFESIVCQSYVCFILVVILARHYIWKLKDNNTPYTIKWKVIARSSAYSPSTKICNLCLTEKYFIICKPQIATLNNRNELASDCRHKRRHLLCNM